MKLLLENSGKMKGQVLKDLPLHYEVMRSLLN